MKFIQKFTEIVENVLLLNISEKAIENSNNQEPPGYQKVELNSTVLCLRAVCQDSLLALA